MKIHAIIAQYGTARYSTLRLGSAASVRFLISVLERDQLHIKMKLPTVQCNKHVYFFDDLQVLKSLTRLPPPVSCFYGFYWVFLFYLFVFCE